MGSKSRLLDEKLLKSIDALEYSDLSAQVRALRDRHFEEGIQLSADKARITLPAWKETENRPVQERWAHVFKRVLEEIPLVIHDGGLTAGDLTLHYRGAYLSPEIDPYMTGNQLKQIDQYGQVMLLSPASFTPEKDSDDKRIAGLSVEDREFLKGATEYFKGKSAMDRLRELRPEVDGDWYKDVVRARGTLGLDHGLLVGTGVPFYEKVLEKGMKGLIEEAECGIAKFGRMEEDDPEKLVFWKSSITVCEAMVTLAHRYAGLAGRLAGETKDPVRKAQLERIAEACLWVPENPPRTLFEAAQMIRLLFLGTRIEGLHSPGAGRMDQYFYPYFMSDLKNGRLTLAEATDILAELYLYLARQQDLLGKLNAEAQQAEAQLVSITLGGLTREGDDGNNELTWLLLHLTGMLRMAQPQPTFRLSRQTPRRFLLKALEVNYRVGGGQPQFHNEEHIFEFLSSKGLSAEDARDWAVFGCSQPFPFRKYGCNISEAFWSNTTLFLDLALHNGVAPTTGKRIGLETGDARQFKSFEELYEAFRKQLEYVTRKLGWHCRFYAKTLGQRYRVPFFSTIVAGCLENGKDLMVGGQADHSNWYAKDRGIVNAADSLTALKKLVFDEKKLTMGEMLDALDGDFAGDRGEEIRRMCLAAPKYGNEIAEADNMVRDIGKFSAKVIHSMVNPFSDKPYAINRNGVGWHYYGGRGVGATADGRKAKEPLSNGSLSPMQGMDRSGPTAVFNSALAAGFKEAATGILNLRFPRNIIGSPESIEKLAALTDTYEKHGGGHVQYNLLDQETLLKAKKNPKKYKDLVVRVAGYSTYFVALSPEIQDELIKRTEHGL